MIITIDGNIPSYYAHSFNVMKMAQGFRDSGQEVELVSQLSWQGIKIRRKVGNLRDFYGVSDDFKITLLPVYNRQFFTHPIRARGYFEKASDYIKKKNPEFVFSRGFITFYNCVKNQIPSIVETHRTDYDHPFMKMLIEVKDHPYFAGLVTIHENIKKEYVERGIPEAKILVLEDGVDTSLYQKNPDKRALREQLGLPQEKTIALYSGGLYKEKGIELIIKTAALFANDDLLFVLVGGNEDQVQHWKKIGDEYGCKNIRFMGFQANKNVPRFLQAADILLMPYDLEMNYKVMDINSTSPLKLFEYMSSGTPIISTDIQVINKIVRHKQQAWLVNPDDREMGIKAAIIELKDHKIVGHTMAQSALKEVQQYTWKHRCETIINELVQPYYQ